AWTTALARSVEGSSTRTAALEAAALGPTAITIAPRERWSRLLRLAAVVLRRCEECAVREVDSALAIDLGDQHLNLIANRADVLDGRNAMIGQLGDVDEAFLP